MANFKKKTQGDNAHLGNLTGAKFVHIDGSSITEKIVLNEAGRLLRVILNTNGATLTLKNGSQEVVGIIALDAPEQTFNYGVYCNDSIRYVAGGALDATLVFAA